MKRVPFFSGMSKREFAAIAKQTDKGDVATGKVLAREGQFGHEFFIIDAGTAEVIRGGETIAALGAGDFFGEMALLEEDRRTATVIAKTPMSLIVMTRSNLRSLDREQPAVHAMVAKAIAERHAPTE